MRKVVGSSIFLKLPILVELFRYFLQACYQKSLNQGLHDFKTIENERGEKIILNGVFWVPFYKRAAVEYAQSSRIIHFFKFLQITHHRWLLTLHHLVFPGSSNCALVPWDNQPDWVLRNMSDIFIIKIWMFSLILGTMPLLGGSRLLATHCFLPLTTFGRVAFLRDCAFSNKSGLNFWLENQIIGYFLTVVNQGTICKIIFQRTFRKKYFWQIFLW